MSPFCKSSRGSGQELLGDERGSLSAEYAVLLVLMAVGGSLALVSAGTPLMRLFVQRQTWLLLPFP